MATKKTVSHPHAAHVSARFQRLDPGDSHDHAQDRFPRPRLAPPRPTLPRPRRWRRTRPPLSTGRRDARERCAGRFFERSEYVQRAPIDLAAPPANALIPPVPSDYVPMSGATYRSVTPKKTELLVLAQAVKNLPQFTSYTQVMGTSAPSYEETLALFTVVNEWSGMRTAASAWDAFCVDQEGLGWATLRPVMLTLRPMFEGAMRGIRRSR